MSQGRVGVPPGTTTIQLANGQVVALADWVDDKLFGSAQLNNGQTGETEAFAAGRSQTIPGGARQQSRADTNLPRNGDSGLPAAYEMLVYSVGILPVRVSCPPTGKTDPVLLDGSGAVSDVPNQRTLFQVDRVTRFDFEYSGKVYTTGTIRDYPPGVGFSGFSTNSSIDNINNGIPSPRDRVSLVLPIHLEENQAFKGIFRPEAALAISQAPSIGATNLTSLDVKVYMFGLLKRPVK